MSYAVIGGQYQAFCYGTVDTLREAIALAEQSAEYWDNWQGWHIPSIYNRDDCTETENFYGRTIRPGRDKYDRIKQPLLFAVPDVDEDGSEITTWQTPDGEVLGRNVWMDLDN